MNELTLSIEQKEKTARLVWTGFILVFFLIQGVVWTVAIVLTSSDASHAVVAGYYEKALHWDEQVAAQRASDSLGWHAEIMVDPDGDIRRVHAITMRLLQSNGTTVAGADIELVAFHRALAGRPQTIAFEEIADGVYAGKIEFRKTGNWQFEGSASVDGQTLLIKEIQLLKASR